MAAPGLGPSGIRRKVDDLGRVVIPAGVRRALNIREGDTVEVAVEGERVVLAKPRDACVFCGREDEDLSLFRGRRLCRECLGSLGELDARTRAVAAADADTATVPTDAPPAPAPSPSDGATAAPAGDAEPAQPRSAPPPRRPMSEPKRSGPVDGDALARDGEAADTAARSGGRPRRPRPPHDPASTTAW